MEQDESLPATVHETAEIIRRNVELEARLIDDLLDLTRISRASWNCISAWWTCMRN